MNGSTIAPSSTDREAGKIDTTLATQLSKNEKDQEEMQGDGPKTPPKIKLTPEELLKHGKSASSIKLFILN